MFLAGDSQPQGPLQAVLASCSKPVSNTRARSSLFTRMGCLMQQLPQHVSQHHGPASMPR
eukprot:2713183-Alexandrium_andersonii.AAC.1